MGFHMGPIYDGLETKCGAPQVAFWGPCGPTRPVGPPGPKGLGPIKGQIPPAWRALLRASLGSDSSLGPIVCPVSVPRIVTHTLPPSMPCSVPSSVPRGALEVCPVVCPVARWEPKKEVPGKACPVIFVSDLR